MKSTTVTAIIAHEEHIRCSVAHDLFDFALVGMSGDTQVAPGLRYVDLVAFHGRMITVMAVMGDPPAEVWRPEEGVRDLGWELDSK